MSTNHLTSTTFTAAMPTVNQTTADMKDSCKDNDEVVYLVSEEVSVRNLLLLAVEQQHCILRDLDLNETFLEETMYPFAAEGKDEITGNETLPLLDTFEFCACRF